MVGLFTCRCPAREKQTSPVARAVAHSYISNSSLNSTTESTAYRNHHTASRGEKATRTPSRPRGPGAGEPIGDRRLLLHTRKAGRDARFRGGTTAGGKTNLPIGPHYREPQTQYFAPLDERDGGATRLRGEPGLGGETTALAHLGA